MKNNKDPSESKTKETKKKTNKYIHPPTPDNQACYKPFFFREDARRIVKTEQTFIDEERKRSGFIFMRGEADYDL